MRPLLPSPFEAIAIAECVHAAIQLKLRPIQLTSAAFAGFSGHFSLPNLTHPSPHHVCGSIRAEIEPTLLIIILPFLPFLGSGFHFGLILNFSVEACLIVVKWSPGFLRV
ncbi:hypothetical protein M758_11G124100 [Ceratodon purpureus]|nr:hypothetical protein M758_11G124100 [Ceratodon purpureus]